MANSDGVKLTKAQSTMLCSLVEGGGFWFLPRGTGRTMNALISLGLAEHRDGTWNGTTAGKRFAAKVRAEAEAAGARHVFTALTQSTSQGK